MSEVETRERAESGFELDGEFYRWQITDTGKDLMLIDRFSGLPVDEFFALADDDVQQRRAPIILATIATSIRAAHPDWSVERITKLVMDVSLGDIVTIDGDSEAQPVPPAVAGAEPATSNSPADESSPSSTPEGNSNSETLYAIPA